jgi:hypothetical protein
LKKAPPILRLYFPNLRKRKTAPDFLPIIQRLGTKAEQYAEALVRLSEAGCQDADYATRTLSKKAIEYQKDFPKKLHEAIDLEEVAPVDLFPSARWKLDRAGLVALQILLRLWQFRHVSEKEDGGAEHRELYDLYKSIAHQLEPFHEDSARRWWDIAQMLFTDCYRHPERVRELASVKAPSCKGSPPKHRNYILRKLRERFLSFAPPALPPRLSTHLVEFRPRWERLVY